MSRDSARQVPGAGGRPRRTGRTRGRPVVARHGEAVEVQLVRCRTRPYEVDHQRLRSSSPQRQVHRRRSRAWTSGRCRPCARSDPAEGEHAVHRAVCWSGRSLTTAKWRATASPNCWVSRLHSAGGRRERRTCRPWWPWTTAAPDRRADAVDAATTRRRSSAPAARGTVARRRPARTTRLLRRELQPRAPTSVAQSSTSSCSSSGQSTTTHPRLGQPFESSREPVVRYAPTRSCVDRRGTPPWVGCGGVRAGSDATG